MITKCPECGCSLPREGTYVECPNQRCDTVILREGPIEVISMKEAKA